MTVLISIPVCRGHTLSRMVDTTNVIPSRKYEMETRDNKERMKALRGIKFAITTEVMTEGDLAGWGCWNSKDMVATKARKGERTLRMNEESTIPRGMTRSIVVTMAERLMGL